MTYEEKISAFVRDISKVHSMTKSESRQKLNEILFHQKEIILDEEKTKKTYDMPMGVSQWRNHGQKWHYWEFWQDELKKEIKKTVETGLKEIIKGEGAYNQDQSIHAANTIENMKEIATNLLKTLEDFWKK